MNSMHAKGRELRNKNPNIPPEDAFDASQPFEVDEFGPPPRRIWPVAMLALLAGFVFMSAVILTLLPMLRPEKQAERIEPAPANPALSQDTGAPVSILPPQPEGVTVLVKQPEETPAGEDAPLLQAPVAGGSQTAKGFAIDLGAADSFSDLSQRFGEIALSNQEVPFDVLEPRATLRETAAGLEARLLVGPFQSLEEAQAACASIALPAGIECRAEPFEGELIARQ